MRSVSLLFVVSAAMAGRLQELCVGDGGSVLPDLSLADLGLRFQLDYQDVSANQNLTESALYPVHVVGGDYEEAMIRVHASEKDFLVNLEPGHEGMECRNMNVGNHDATIWVTMEPTASYVQLLSLGSATFDIWVSVNTTVLGYDRYSFDVVPDEEELALLAVLRETDGEVDDSVVLPNEDDTKTQSLSNETDVSSSNTPTPSPSKLFLTFPPTSTSFPTSTSSPTYTEPCHLCRDPFSRVTNADALTSIMGLAVQCGVLQSWADDNLLSENTCSVALEAVAEVCDCKPMEDSPAPSSVLTLPPTSTMLPTITSSPTYSTKCVLDTKSHCFDGDASMNMLGLAYPCKAIVEQGAKGLLSPETCSVAHKALERGDCACSPTLPPLTRIPTASPLPTLTVLPTYTEPCIICTGDDTQSVEVFDQVISCGELRAFGQSSFIDPLVCPEAQRIAELTCNCPTESVEDPMESVPVEESAEAPTTSPSLGSIEADTQVKSPSSTSSCDRSAAYVATGVIMLLVFFMEL